MKKVLFSLSMFAVLVFAGQSCKKASAEDNVAQVEMNNEDNSTISEEFLDIQEDPIFESEAGTPTVTFAGGTKATDADGDGICTTFKYKDAYKVGTDGSTLTLTLSSSAIIDSITNENTSTGAAAAAAAVTKVGGHLLFSDVSNTATATTTATVKLATENNGFRAGSAKMVVYMRVKAKDTSTTYTVAKKKAVTIKCVGLDGTGYIFGTQAWGFNKESASGLGSGYDATPTAIDSNYVPALGDILTFGGATGKQKAFISSTPIKTAMTTSASSIAKGDKYAFEYIIWNASCKSSRKLGKATIYSKIAPTTVAATGGPALTHYKR